MWEKYRIENNRETQQNQMLALHKHQQSLQTLVRLTKRGKKESSNCLSQEWKRKHYYQSYRKKDCKEI